MIKKYLKKLYILIPFKKQIFSGIKKTGKVPERIYRHLTFKGAFKVVIDKGRSFKLRHYGFVLENEIFWEGLTGKWEKESIELWIKLCKDANIVFDIGANTGVYSLVAQTINPQATIYAFEPLKTICDKLIANNRLNNYSITCCEIALSDHDGKAAIYKVNSDHTYEATLNKVFEGKLADARAIEVEIVTAKTFIEQNGITNIDLIKIDVETHEPEVLEGFGEYLLKFKPTILIELITDYVVEGVIPVVKDLGYLFFNIDEKKGIQLTETLNISDSYNYLFCTREKAEQLKLI